MSKVKPLLPGPVAAARRVLDECDVRHPRDIYVEAMAARYGAIVVYGPMSTARGAIVRTANRAVIWIDERAKGEPRADFTGAHEFAHHLLHGIIDHFAQCHGDESAAFARSPEAREADKRVRAVEREANHFSTELLMPEKWAAPLCKDPRPTLDDVDRLARTFRTSFHASAIRFLELTEAPCAFVHSVAGRIKRSSETASFPGTIVQRRELHPGSAAARLQHERAGASHEPREVAGAAWGCERGERLVEHAVVLGPDVGVFSWIVPAA